MRLFVFSLAFFVFGSFAADGPKVHNVHPRLLGSRADLQALAKARPQEFTRMVAVANDKSADSYSRGVSLGLVAAINEDKEAAREAQAIAMKIVNGPIRQGHVTFGTDLALCGLIYDLAHEAWSEADRAKFHEYFNKTVDANVQSETHVFHNAWFSYKNWGIGIGALAAYHENPRAAEIFATLDKDYRTRAASALQLAGEGGGWAEGYYIHYWLYEWLFFCEVARRSAGLDYYAEAPAFYKNRALASAFEMYPGKSEYNTRRPIPMGDGGGRKYGGDRDKALAARRILVNFYREDPIHQALHTYNEQTPRVGSGLNAYKDFLWHDTTITKGDLKSLPLSHYAKGPGYVYARSSWEDDATYFFFKAGDRFTAHQHLDNGHFLIYRGGELLGDGGHYESFGTAHDVNYHMRTVAHNTITVFDETERWPDIRGGKVTGNDGGQHHNWPHHNGAVGDPQEWLKNRHLYDIADIYNYADTGAHVAITANLTKSYSSNKVEKLMRQVVYLRPSTFIVFDQVTSVKPEQRKTFLLQAMTPPVVLPGKELMITNGTGSLIVQTLLPKKAMVQISLGEVLYNYDAQTFLPKENTGPAPEARIQVIPSEPAKRDLFLHVLTAGDAATTNAPPARVVEEGQSLQLYIGDRRLVFRTEKP